MRRTCNGRNFEKLNGGIDKCLRRACDDGEEERGQDNLNFPAWEAQESLSFLLSTSPFSSGCKVEAMAVS